MKLLKSLFILLAIFSCLYLSAQIKMNDQKILIAYFSRSGNTKAIAQEIQYFTKGTLFEIQKDTPYPSEYKACTEVAKKEKDNNDRPPLKESVKNIVDYDIVFVGYPNWWGTMPMPVCTFLDNHDLDNAILIPFCTHGGGGEQNLFRDFAKYTTPDKSKKGFLIHGADARDAENAVSKWLREIQVL
ncbi:MAG: flavodoxin [Bacteroidales bacterium]